MKGRSTESVTWEYYLPAFVYITGTEAGIRLYLPEIVALLCSCLQSQAWSVKAQAARAMTTVAQKLQSQLGQPHLGDLLSSLLDGLSGRTWEGKVINTMVCGWL